MPLDRKAYRNPAPPPGYVHMQKSEIKLKENFRIIDGVCCEFLGLIVDSGVLESDVQLDTFTICSDDEDVLELPVERKETPFIDLVEDEDFPEADVGVKGSKPLAVQSITKRKELETQEKNITIYKSPVKSSQNSEKSELKTPEKNNQNIMKSKSPVKSSKITEKNESQNTVIGNEEHLKKIKKSVKVKESAVINSKKDVYHEKKLSHRSVKGDQLPHREKGNSLENVVKDDVSPKRRTLKKEVYEDHSSDSSTHSSSYSRKKATKETRSSYAEYSDFEDEISKVKKEATNTLHGYYYCELCKADMTSELTYETHVKGKRHLKNLKQKNVVETVAKSLVPFQVENNYPQPAPGVYRVKSKAPSTIQNLVDRLPTPCPGLHQVIEIQGLGETSFYCELCSAPCTSVTIIPHLSGYRHQLRCLKFFDMDKYESVRNKKKQKIERVLLKWLQDIERLHGRGQLTVEKEFLGKTEAHKSVNTKGERWGREAIAGPSHRDPDDAFPENYSSTTIPDTSKSDFYCKICDSHMNSINMWEMHIRGKRHIANSKKAPGELPSKTKTVLLPNERALIMDELEEINEPIVGLSDMRENRTPGSPGAMYNCFLCGACVTTMDVIDHILSLKHRRKYLEKIKHPDIEMINELNIHDNHMESVIIETCEQVERELGRGEMEVHVSKSAVSVRW